MNEMNATPESPRPVRRRRPTAAQIKAKRKATAVRILLRSCMVLLTTILLVFGGAVYLLNGIFNGPSISARNILTMSLAKSSGTWWIPGMFLDAETVEQIKKGDVEATLPPIVDPGDIEVIIGGSLNSDEWKNHPDGIYIKKITGATYTAHVMIVRDPSAVYMGTSSKKFSSTVPGGRLNQVMEATGALAGINAGAFYDDGTSGVQVGATPYGLVISEGEVLWNDGLSYQGFVGFTEDHIMVVSPTMTAAKAKELGIRDGCCFGPVLIQNGQINTAAYNNSAGWNPRTAIGQRADGAVIMVAVEGRQMGSVGADYKDLIDIMVEYGAVNACNLDGGSSTVMYYRDTYGLYGDPGKVQLINNYSLLQEEPRRMPTFFLVRPSEEG